MTIAVASLVIGLSGFLGMKARSTTADLAAKRALWDSTETQLASVQHQFRVPSAAESAALAAEASRMSALAVPADERVGLVDLLGHLAEALSLSSVRVSSVRVPDGLTVPVRQVGGSSIKPASYVIAVEFVGRFAEAQKFVSSLPPSLSLSRLTAARREGGALYKLILSVYEIDANSGD